MNTPDSARARAIRLAIDDHLKRRRNTMLAKISGTDKAAEDRRAQITARLEMSSLLAGAAEVCNQIQLATHIVKAIHPDPKVTVATNLNVNPLTLDVLDELGSHVLGHNFEVDATGNGAHNAKVFEAYSLLRTSIDGKSLLDLLRDGDEDALTAISADPDQAADWARKFSTIDASRTQRPASNTLAKQIYWLTGTDVHDDSHYQLLAPLYPTSLAHRVYLTLQDDRFSDAAKAARAAKKAGEPHERPVRDYPNLALQGLGGTKPQNISQLNSERRGDNALLASLPPVWISVDIKPVLHTESLFAVYGRRPDVRRTARQLRDFLITDPARNVNTRQRRDDWIDDLINELLLFTAELRSLPAGWTQGPDCDLSAAERRWVDPEGDQPVDDAATVQVAEDFANWINKQLRPPLPVGDPEFLAWRKQALDAFKADEREAA